MTPDADRKPPAARAAHWAGDGKARVVALTCLALACSASVATGWGPARAVGGALLACYLPGRLALGALRRPGARPDPALDLALAVALSLVATMLLGAVAAGFGLGFTDVRTAVLSAALSAALGLAAHRRAGAGRMPAGADARTESTGAPRRFSPRVALAAVPALALTAVLTVQVIAYVRDRPDDSYYTELSAVAAGGQATVRIHSRERVTETFRCEQRLDSVLVRQDRFVLRPGRSILLPVATAGTGRVEIRLFRGTEADAYRRLVL